MLSKHADDLLPTEIPDDVYETLKSSPVTDVHIFARRGPAQVKFSPLELRELGHVPDVDVVVYPEDFEFDDGSMAAIESTNQTKQVVKTLTDWALEDPSTFTGSRRIHVHFLHAPVEVLGDGKVEVLRTERTKLDGDGSVSGTGEFTDWPVQAVYRAVGYFGSELKEVPFDPIRGVIPNREGRITDLEGAQVPGLYATGWIKRGPVGLIGHTKSDASETIRHLVEDAAELPAATKSDPQDIITHLVDKGVEVIEWADWERVEAHEISLGAPHGRERVKLASRQEMIAIAKAAKVAGANC